MKVLTKTFLLVFNSFKYYVFMSRGGGGYWERNEELRKERVVNS